MPTASCPPISTSPSSGCSEPEISLSVVVLPQPERAEQRQELAVPDSQGHVVDGGEIAEPLGDGAELDVVRTAVVRGFRLLVLDGGGHLSSSAG